MSRYRNKEEKKDFLPGQKFLHGSIMPAYQQRRYFTKLPDEKALFFYPLSNLVYSLGDMDVTVKYKLDFGDKNPPHDINKQISDNNDLFDFIDEHFPVAGFNSCWENDQYFYIQTRINKEPVDLLYNKKTKKFYAGHLLDDMVDCSTKFTQATNQWLVGYVSANDILDLIDYMQSKNIPPNATCKKIFDFAENVGNPTILLYKFK